VITHIKSLFSRLTEVEQPTTKIDFKTALAALLVEVMRADGEIKSAEINKIHTILSAKSDLSSDDTNSLIELAQGLVEQAIDLYSFVSVINEQTSDIERIDIIELLWHVALADGEIDSYEDHIIRKISSLMYVSHVDFIQAKINAGQKDSN
jgi:uncharacterized tellurite resistance protein B-like protein